MEIARHWRIRGQRYGLTGSICTHCGKAYFAPRAICNECQQKANENYSYERFSLANSILSEGLGHK